jgi:hypothetical protein
LDEVEFVFFVVVYGEVECCLVAGKDRQAIRFFEWSGLL